MSLLEKLSKVQLELKAPKNQYNTFGKYNYRSCEDILEVAKPLCIEHGLMLVLSDEPISCNDRVYIEATATVYDIEGNEKFEVTASARESLTKKGMDDSQITGTASSYARKYALNGLFCIDDTKDADTDEHAKQTTQSSNNNQSNEKVTVEMLENMAKLKHVPISQLIDRYKNETNKSVDDIKYISKDKKAEYYNDLKKMPIKEG